MSADFWILLLCAAGAAHGAAVAIGLQKRRLLALFAILLYTFVGMHTVLLAVMSGDGRILPARQLSPGLKALWGDTLASTPFPHPGFTLLVLLAHALVFLPQPRRPAFWRPLPVTLVFLGLFVVMNRRTEQPPTQHDRAVGPETTAYVTQFPIRSGKGTRFVISDGKSSDSFARVRFVHNADGGPPRRARLFWTADGKGIVIMILRQRLLAIDLENDKVIGGLPEKSHEWPRENMAVLSKATLQKLSEWRREVELYLKAHGGPYIR